MAKKQIKTFKAPGANKIYAYAMPGVVYREGQIKIGQTKKTPEERVAEQTFTVGIRTKLEWRDFARFRDGSGEFGDTDFHRWLGQRKNVFHIEEEGEGREIFQLSPATSLRRRRNGRGARKAYNAAPEFPAGHRRGHPGEND